MNKTSLARISRKLPATRVAGAFVVTAVLIPVALAGTTASAQERGSGPGDHWAGSTIAAHQDASLAPPALAAVPSGPQGIDVSHHQGTINWTKVAGAGIKFAYMKATEGTTFLDNKFDTNYINSYNAGLIRGAYHFATPNSSSGAAQATFFTKNGGKWSGDGKTLPPMLDMEYNPSGAACYGLSQSAMVNWIKDFSNTTKKLAGRYPSIYTNLDWWKTCTGNSGAFNKTNALVVARWSSSPGTLPNWPAYTIWQFTDSGSVAGVSGKADRDVFNGSADRLKAFAKCNEENPC